ncbi:MAG: 2-dehydropantoate 2-reductase [Opitutales bacterium]|nr:2-dehydropantoate 2-reductase [Opitutales bacterium]MCH8540791.1 2-dehydropantoate 2-reductase [Opitutales bacterium]
MPSSPPQRIAIVGAGALGGLYGGLLQRAGHEVLFVARSASEALTKDGLTVRLPEESFTIPVNACRETTSQKPVDLVLICGKATENPALAKHLPPLLQDHTRIVTLQNGMGNAEFFAKAVGSERILGGLCFVCTNRTGPTEITCTTLGKIEFAEAFPSSRDRAPIIAELFSQAGIPSRAFPSLEEIQWRKLAWNIPFNGLAIVGGGITTDRIMASAELVQLGQTLMAEISRAAKSRGYSLEQEFLEKQFNKTRHMGSYAPSSLLDYQAGKAVEVEPIFGIPLRRAEESGIALPTLRALYLLLSHLVQSRTDSAEKIANEGPPV